ncbi:MAG: YibE/F family protein, partial [Oscillospiraceae bacterium]
YIGSSLSMVVLLSAYNDNLLQVLNREMIVTEILQGLVGSIGILLTIPLTSFLAAAIFPAMKKSHHQNELTDNAVILPETDPKNDENDNSL